MDKKIYRCYMAGPIGTGGGDLHANIRNGIEQELSVMLHPNLAPFHTFSSYTLELHGHVPRETWLETDLAWLEVADCLFAIDGWVDSHGAKAEVEMANMLGIPAFFEIEHLFDWAERGE